MDSSEDAAYARAALSTTVVLFRTLLKKGLITREEAVRIILDEAVSKAIQAEAAGRQRGGPPMRGDPEVDCGTALTEFWSVSRHQLDGRPCSTRAPTLFGVARSSRCK